jgi:hypothetical protein
MTKREKLDPSWHKARVAARIWLKAKQGRPLSARDKRLARVFADDPAVEDRLIEQGVAYWRAPWMLDSHGQRIRRVCNVVDNRN